MAIGINEVAIRDFFSSRRMEQVFEVIRRLLTRPQAITATTTLTSSNTVLEVDATSGAVTINLPRAGDHASRVYVIKKIDATANTVTVDGYLAETIDGALTQVLATQWQSLTIISDGTNWLRIGAVTIGGGGGAVNSGTATLSFGATGSTSAKVTVVGQPWVTGTNVILPSVVDDARAEDAVIEGLTLAIANQVVGTGFDILGAPALGDFVGDITIAFVGV